MASSQHSTGKEHFIQVLTDSGVVEDLGVASVGVLSPELPHVEEGLPVDEGQEDIEVEVVEDLGADEGGPHGGKVHPVYDELALAGGGQALVLAVLEVVVVVLADVLVLLGHVLDVLVAGLLVQQARAL